MYVCAQKNERLTRLFMRIFLLVLFPDFHVVVKTNLCAANWTDTICNKLSNKINHVMCNQPISYKLEIKQILQI